MSSLKVKTIKEQIFRVECSVNECLYSEMRACLEIAPDRIKACAQCRYQEIPDQNWVCYDCGKEFDRLEKYFDIPFPPDIDEIMEAPEVYPNMRAVPAVCRIKRFCGECYKNFKDDTKTQPFR